jgi:hypothetical protein
MFARKFFNYLNNGWSGVFAQKRTQMRIMMQTIVLALCLGKRTITRSIMARKLEQRDWSAEYKVLSRSPWDPMDLFIQIIKDAIANNKGDLIVVNFDDTKIKKTGKKINTAFRSRDPLSPAFHVNLIWGLRFLQASISLPHYLEDAHCSWRSYPIAFEEVPVVKKPGKKASEEQIEEYLQAKKEQNLSVAALELMRDIKTIIDKYNHEGKKIIFVFDGSYCNKTIMKTKIAGVDFLGRCRRDAVLCFPAPEGGRRKYSEEKFSPEDVLNNKKIVFKSVNVYIGGKYRNIKYKEVKNVLWQNGSGQRGIRLIVIKGAPYRMSKNGNQNNRRPAFLLCTDNEIDVAKLIQAYIERWGIEENHRDEKSIFGVGDAQLWSKNSVPRHPALMVATYSALLMFSYLQYGPTRTKDYLELPKWRKKAYRPSLLDILALLRLSLQDKKGSCGQNYLPTLKDLAICAYS